MSNALAFRSMNAGAFCFSRDELSPVALEENCERIHEERGARSHLPEGARAMKLITCVIRPDRLPAVKEALFRAGVTGITITRASGHGGERDTVTVRRGTSLLLQFHDNVKNASAIPDTVREVTLTTIC